MKLFDVVIIKADHPEHVITAGTTGVIVEILDLPNKAYLVEVTNEQGETIVELPLEVDELIINFTHDYQDQ
ncbi:MAG: DUF4926 domain-containing protein [Algicola sp.]|nr:DUF4926 domain-containing protein [Algicola sp.]